MIEHHRRRALFVGLCSTALAPIALGYIVYRTTREPPRQPALHHGHEPLNAAAFGLDDTVANESDVPAISLLVALPDVDPNASLDRLIVRFVNETEVSWLVDRRGLHAGVQLLDEVGQPLATPPPSLPPRFDAEWIRELPPHSHIEFTVPVPRPSPRSGGPVRSLRVTYRPPKDSSHLERMLSVPLTSDLVDVRSGQVAPLREAAVR